MPDAIYIPTRFAEDTTAEHFKIVADPMVAELRDELFKCAEKLPHNRFNLELSFEIRELKDDE